MTNEQLFTPDHAGGGATREVFENKHIGDGIERPLPMASTIIPRSRLPELAHGGGRSSCFILGGMHELVVGEVARRLPDHLLLAGQGEIHTRFLSERSPPRAGS
jgi:hypothetical protein